MSIELLGVSHAVRTKSQGVLKLRDINMAIEKDQRVALLGKKGSGIDQLVELICGSAVALHGTVRITSEISWPIGEASFLLNEVSPATNLRFVARIYEVDDEAYLARVDKVAELGKHWNLPYSACPRDLKSRFTFALGVCLPFDIYIFDSLDSVDKEFREQADQIVDGLAREAGILLVSAKGEAALEFCDRAFVLDDGKISYYEDIEAAVAHLDRLRDKGGAVEEVEEEESSDVDAFDII